MKKYFVYDAQPKHYDEVTAGMSEKMKQGLGNALAHHMMPLFRNDHGVWMTRMDYLTTSKERGPLSLLDNEGKWHYHAEFKS